MHPQYLDSSSSGISLFFVIPRNKFSLTFFVSLVSMFFISKLKTISFNGTGYLLFTIIFPVTFLPLSTTFVNLSSAFKFVVANFA